MSNNEALERLRAEIDAVDNQLAPLLERRMGIVEEVARLKQDSNLPVLDESREQQILDRLLPAASQENRGHLSLLMRTVMALSRSKQRSTLAMEEALLPPPEPVRSADITCAYQGVPGAWSEHALLQVLPEAKRLQAEYFEDVFLAVREGRAHYGVIAMENSQTGAIGETYDLLKKYGCYIVGRTTVRVRHCLLAREGAKLSDIGEVFSHPEGFKQCSRFLHRRGWELSGCRNTAAAAQKAAEDRTGGAAAIGSRRAGELNGLQVLSDDIMDSRDNQTTFAVIGARPEYDEGCQLTAISFSTLHRSGALCESLLPLLAEGINLTRIESRPGHGGHYRFFAEVEGNVLTPHVARALQQVRAASEYFEVIGCYSEVEA